MSDSDEEDRNNIPPVELEENRMFAQRYRENFLKRRQESMDPSADEPLRKRAISEEKMVARMQNVRIENQPQFTPEYFTNVANGLSSSSDEDEIDQSSAIPPSSNQGPSLEPSPATKPSRLEILDPQLKEYLQKKESAFSPFLRTPSNNMQVAIWKPPGSFVQDLMTEDSTTRTTDYDDETMTGIIDLEQAEEMDGGPFSNNLQMPKSRNCTTPYNNYQQGTEEPIITFPPTPEEAHQNGRRKLSPNRRAFPHHHSAMNQSNLHRQQQSVQIEEIASYSNDESNFDHHALNNNGFNNHAVNNNNYYAVNNLLTATAAAASQDTQQQQQYLSVPPASDCCSIDEDMDM